MGRHGDPKRMRNSVDKSPRIIQFMIGDHIHINVWDRQSCPYTVTDRIPLGVQKLRAAHNEETAPGSPNRPNIKRLYHYRQVLPNILVHFRLDGVGGCPGFIRSELL